MKGGIPREAVVANCDYVGDGYGIPTEGMGEAVAHAGAGGGDPARPGLFRQGDGRDDRPDPQGRAGQGRDHRVPAHRRRGRAVRLHHRSWKARSDADQRAPHPDHPHRQPAAPGGADRALCAPRGGRGDRRGRARRRRQGRDPPRRAPADRRRHRCRQQRRAAARGVLPVCPPPHERLRRQLDAPPDGRRRRNIPATGPGRRSRTACAARSATAARCRRRSAR